MKIVSVILARGGSKGIPRRQDKEELFVENGAFYINSRNSILKNKLRYSGNIGIVEMPLYESFQVDELNDLTLINRILHYDKL